MDPFLGEIRYFSFNYVPQNWASCNGAQMQVKQNAALFSLLNKFYGGDGITNFNLPDLRGRVAMGFGSFPAPSGSITYNLGASGGMETVPLTIEQMPGHTHNAMATNLAGNAAIPTSNTLAKDGTPSTGTPFPIYADLGSSPSPLVPLNAAALGSTGGGAGHENRQPFLTLNACIAITGIYPPRQ
jgi:microcystin-dependent protein